jgi:hypothetical protein
MIGMGSCSCSACRSGFVAPGIAAWALPSLLKANLRQKWNAANVFCTLAGIVLALGGCSPVMMLAYRLITLRAGE